MGMSDEVSGTRNAYHEQQQLTKKQQQIPRLCCQDDRQSDASLLRINGFQLDTLLSMRACFMILILKNAQMLEYQGSSVYLEHQEGDRWDVSSTHLILLCTCGALNPHRNDFGCLSNFHGGRSSSAATDI